MDELWHYGTPRHSGRYPWGSGENPYQHENFRRRYRDLQKQGLTNTQIAKVFKMSTGELRALNTVALEDELRKNTDKAVDLYFNKHYSKTAIADYLGVSEGKVRYMLRNVETRRNGKVQLTAEALKEQLESKPFLDIGKGVSTQLGQSETTMKAAVERLKLEGYSEVVIDVAQATNPSQYTSVKVLVKNPDNLSEKELKRYVWENRDKITSPAGLYFEDYGTVKKEVHPPVSIDSKRVAIRYADDPVMSGKDADGVIEIRRGVEDLSLGNNSYAQVRIAVDGDRYLKGMAIYSDNVPDGYDIIFNTNKNSSVPKSEVLKEMKRDKQTNEILEDNPFGAVVKQPRDYIGADGQKHQSAINIVNEDSDWERWTKSLSSQFLSKQPVPTAKKQLNLRAEEMEKEFHDICELTNPTVKRKLLESFADDCDSAAVHLKAAAFPRQATHVILPVRSLKDTEVYAPNYEQGEEVILIRYPHAGTFEIPRLTVNNKNEEAIRNLGKNPPHAIGINTHVAQQLSGADFDGDTVVVIPTKGQKVISKDYLEGLKNFDPSERYSKTSDQIKTGPRSKGPDYDGFNKGMQMGVVSNLITDMTLRGAKPEEIVRAVKHSMVVIDAEKHNLDWKKSEQDNNIAQLKRDYQGKTQGGASTLISRAKKEYQAPERKEITRFSSMTDDEKKRYLNGERIFRETGELRGKKVNIRVDENGKETYDWVKTNKLKTQSHDWLAYERDANKLSSGTLMEKVYADYSNRLKSLADEARKELRTTGLLKVNRQAKDAYAEERKSIIFKLNECLKNAPFERQAQLIANVNIKMREEANPDWDKDDKKKQRAIAISNARRMIQAATRKELAIEITPREWEAIQAGAISDNQLSQVLRYADMSIIRQYATPRTGRGLTPAKIARARTMLNNGHTQSEVADALGISVSTLRKELAD